MDKENAQASGCSSRKPYTSPRLITYGDLEEITLQNTGASLTGDNLPSKANKKSGG